MDEVVNDCLINAARAIFLQRELTEAKARIAELEGLRDVVSMYAREERAAIAAIPQHFLLELLLLQLNHYF